VTSHLRPHHLQLFFQVGGTSHLRPHHLQLSCQVGGTSHLRPHHLQLSCEVGGTSHLRPNHLQLSCQVRLTSHLYPYHLQLSCVTYALFSYPVGREGLLAFTLIILSTLSICLRLSSAPKDTVDKVEAEQGKEEGNLSSLPLSALPRYDFLLFCSHMSRYSDVGMESTHDVPGELLNPN
jgi:hypothetical protein